MTTLFFEDNQGFKYRVDFCRRETLFWAHIESGVDNYNRIIVDNQIDWSVERGPYSTYTPQEIRRCIDTCLRNTAFL